MSIRSGEGRLYAVLSNWPLERRLCLAYFYPYVFISDELILGVYVDDVLMAGTTDQVSAQMEEAGGRFKFKDLGRPKMLSGLEIEFHGDGVRLYQQTDAQAILRRYGISKNSL